MQATATAMAAMGGTEAEAGAGISVIIPHLNQHAALVECLESLATQTTRPHEVVVVDNGSTRLPEAECAAYPGARLLVEPCAGPGPARNRGVAATQGAILAFIDADCTAAPDWIEVARARLATEPETGILGGDVRIALRKPGAPDWVEAYESEFAYRMEHYIRDQGFTGTGNLVVRRSVMDAVGPFGGIDVAEDRDWGQRAAAAGYETRFEPRMRVWHPARPDMAALCAKIDRLASHDHARAAARPGGRAGFVLKALAMAPSALVALPRVLSSDRLPGPGTKLRAAAALLVLRCYRAFAMLRVALARDPGASATRWNRGA